ncbi:DUF4129 domain-containing protein [Solemya velesiana gill symbiont]|uniref:DUF4129 domain-containing protein n=1 Tax=Solemya velesiana gill symbiont TaxID=1918948 RepID=A0A1T2KW30_9GAMM|nr:DUF4129 domain-containing protein [Solemya velesiana gill symbiont]OOZ37034.1 hypothetical protein BOW51_04280 [Solemya velesiana gill symbiont]
MEIGSLQIALRKRGHWEAIDLGFTLARRWFMPLWQLWFMTALPLGLLALLLAGGEVWILLLALWWFKPFYEPPLLFWMSRAVFGEPLTRKDVARQWWRIVRPQLFANLTWRRFSPNRSFNMPVALLEGLRRKARSSRISILGQGQHAATWLTFVGLILETILETSMILVLYFLIPEELRWIDVEMLVFAEGRVGEWLQVPVTLIAMSVIAPFYVAGGFALYLHRRSELEGWDIEINFRRTAERLKQGKQRASGVTALVLVAALASFSVPDFSMAAEVITPEKSKQVVEEVLQDETFGRYEQHGYWKYVGEEDRGDEADTEGLLEWLELLFDIIGGFFKEYAAVGEVVLWGLAVLVVVFLIYKIVGNRDWFLDMLQGDGRGRRSRQVPLELFGLDIRPDTLPKDIAAEASLLVRDGRIRSALSLLYRGALVRLVQDHHLEIPASATEGECLELVRMNRDEDEVEYFTQLTSRWLSMAYAHVTPGRDDVEMLCNRWRMVYGHVQG